MQPKQPIRVCVNGIINVIDNTNTNTHTYCTMADLPAAPFRSQSRFARPQVVFLSQPVDHDYAGLVQTGNHTHRTRQFILNKRLRSISFNENNKGQLSDVWLYKKDCRREEKRLSFCVHQVLCIRLCQPCQEACHCSEARESWCHPPLFMFYSTPSLSWQPSMFSPPKPWFFSLVSFSPPHHLFFTM